MGAMDTGQMIPVDGILTHVRIEGHGPPVILLHGWAASSECWTYTVEALRGRFTVIAPDLPGHGRSAGGRWPYELAFYCRWLTGLLDALELPPVTLMGNSLGGALSIAWALTHPGRVSRVVLVNPVGLSESFPWGTAARMLPRTPYLLAAAATRRADPYVLRSLEGLAIVDPWGAAREPIIRVSEVNLARGLLVWWPGLRMLAADFLPDKRRRRFFNELAALEPPALIIWGQQDAMLPIDPCAAGSRRIPGAQVEVLPRSAHMPMLEEPEAFNAIVQEFLSRPRSDRREYHVSDEPHQRAERA